MIPAYHIIGFSALELGRYTYDPTPAKKADVEAAIAARYTAIRQAGVIHARCHQPQVWDSPGRSTWEDDLVGDDRYVFLSVGPRYADQVDAAAYGFVFDAEALIERGAVLGLGDLAADYTEIIGVAAENVAAALPRLPRITEAELDEFMALMGESDPAMRQFISDKSTDPESGLLEALRDGDVTHPGYAPTAALIQQRVADLHREQRLTGAAALARLRQTEADGGLEILVLERLPLAWAVGRIEAGVER